MLAGPVVAVVAVALLSAFLLRRNPGSTVMICLALWVLFPEAASHAVFANTPLVAIHPAALLAVTAVVVLKVNDLSSRHFTARAGGPATAAMVLATVIVLAQVILLSGDGTSFVIDQVLAGFALAWLTLSVPDNQLDGFRLRLSRLIVGLAAVESVLALVQKRLQEGVPYDTYLRDEYYWFVPEFDRWTGTLDHPLVLAVLLASAAFLLPVVPYVPVRWSLLALFFAGMLVTQSRTGLVAILLALTFLLFKARMSLLQRLSALTVAVLGSSWALSAFVASNTYSRFLDDSQSSYARNLAYRAFFADIPSPLLLGDGVEAARLWGFQHGLISSLENPVLIFSLNFGVLFTATYFGLAVALLNRGRRLKSPLEYRLAASCAGLLVLTFSSLATTTALPALVWVLLAVASRAVPPPADDVPVAATAARASSPRIRRL